MRTARAANAALWVLVISLAVLAGATAVIPAIRGWQSVALMGQSMTPTYEMGDLVYVDARAKADIGDVITFDHEGRLWTHRIVQQTHSRQSFDEVRWQTRGDNPTLGNDPFLVDPASIRGVVVSSLPWVGYLDLYVRTPMTWVVIVLTALLLMYLAKKTTP